MKTKQLWAAALLVGGIFIGSAQTNIASSTLTSRGLEAGTVGTGNAFYGYRAGKANLSTGNNNTFLGNRSGAANTSGQGNVYLGSSAGSVNTNANGNVFVGAFTGTTDSSGSGNTFIGYFSGAESTGNNNVFLGQYAGFGETRDNQLYIDNEENPTPLIYGDFSANKLVFNGKVGITNEALTNQANLFPTNAGGVNVTAYQLFVKGGILTEEVRVMTKNTTNWADYVFEDSYNLKPLSEVEDFINKNGHLPNMPSAKQVAQEGIEVSDMAKKQQEKIEELTLYAIEQNKKIEKLEQQINELNTQNKELQDLKAKVEELLNEK